MKYFLLLYVMVFDILFVLGLIVIFVFVYVDIGIKDIIEVIVVIKLIILFLFFNKINFFLFIM